MIAPALGRSPVVTDRAEPATASNEATGRPTLRALGEQAGLRIGTAVDLTALADDPAYRAQVARALATTLTLARDDAPARPLTTVAIEV